MKVIDFTGPLFIVGMPRSGTKLLRDLLNRHSKIGIPDHESHFIPRYWDRFNKFGELHDRTSFEKFYRELSVGSFFTRLAEKGHLPGINEWRAAVRDWSYSGVIEAFYRTYAQSIGKTVWGDKTPGYLVKLDLLFDLFPVAKTVHIVRDPRDYCLSINNAWGKNIYRSAQRWQEDVAKCREAGRRFGRAYLEVRYEDLLDDTERILSRICTFIGLDFEQGMLSLERPSENLGDTKGECSVVKGNYGKWRKRLKPVSVGKIESLCGNLMLKFNYEIGYDGPIQRLSSVEMSVFKVMDIINLFRFHCRDKGGFLKALRWMVRASKMAGNGYN